MAAFLTPPHSNTKGEIAKGTIQVSPFDTLILCVDYLSPDRLEYLVNPNLMDLPVRGHQGGALPALVVVCIYNMYTVGLAAPLLRFNTVYYPQFRDRVAWVVGQELGSLVLKHLFTSQGGGWGFVYIVVDEIEWLAICVYDLCSEHVPYPLRLENTVCFQVHHEIRDGVIRVVRRMGN